VAARLKPVLERVVAELGKQPTLTLQIPLTGSLWDASELTYRQQRRRFAREPESVFGWREGDAEGAHGMPGLLPAFLIKD
jgi:hypothetical protein